MQIKLCFQYITTLENSWEPSLRCENVNDANIKISKLQKEVLSILEIDWRCESKNETNEINELDLSPLNKAPHFVKIKFSSVDLNKMNKVFDFVMSNAFKEITLMDCNLNDTHATKISKYLNTTDTLEFLSVALNPITPTGVSQLAEALKTNRTVTGLQLAFTKSNNDAATMLCNVIKENNKLQHLTFSVVLDTPLTWVNPLAEALAVNKTLTSLFITQFECVDNKRENRLSMSDIVNLSKSISIYKTLKNLDLEPRLMMDSQALSLAHLLKG